LNLLVLQFQPKSVDGGSGSRFAQRSRDQKVGH